jgi:hypothetical protein
MNDAGKTKYTIKIVFQSGYIRRSELFFSGDEKAFRGWFSEDISEGFYPRSNGEVSVTRPLVQQIVSIELCKDRLLQKECPPIFLNGKGYVFSSKGLERIVAADPEKDSLLATDYFVPGCRNDDPYIPL